MIVVDTNIVAYLLLPGEWTAAAESLWISDGEWAAPLLWRSEFRNILAGYMRRGLLTLEHAQEVQAAAENLLAGDPCISSQVISEYINVTRRMLSLSKYDLLSQTAALIARCEIAHVFDGTLTAAAELVKKFDLHSTKLFYYQN